MSHGEILKVYVDEITLARLEATSKELGRDIKELAECAVSEAALAGWRGRKDDPANKFGERF